MKFCSSQRQPKLYRVVTFWQRICYITLQLTQYIIYLPKNIFFMRMKFRFVSVWANDCHCNVVGFYKTLEIFD